MAKKSVLGSVKVTNNPSNKKSVLANLLRVKSDTNRENNFKRELKKRYDKYNCLKIKVKEIYQHPLYIHNFLDILNILNITVESYRENLQHLHSTKSKHLYKDLNTKQLLNLLQMIQNFHHLGFSFEKINYFLGNQLSIDTISRYLSTYLVFQMKESLKSTINLRQKSFCLIPISSSKLKKSDLKKLPFEDQMTQIFQQEFFIYRSSSTEKPIMKNSIDNISKDDIPDDDFFYEGKDDELSSRNRIIKKFTNVEIDKIKRNPLYKKLTTIDNDFH